MASNTHDDSISGELIPAGQKPHRGGRPTVRTPAIIETILEHVTAGVPLAQVLRMDGMPCVSAFYNWLNEDKELDGRFARAREFGADAIASDCLEIADEGETGVVVGKDGTSAVVFDATAVQRNKLRVDTRLKLLAKWDRRYADKQQIEHSGKMSLEQLVAGGGGTDSE